MAGHWIAILHRYSPDNTSYLQSSTCATRQLPTQPSSPLQPSIAVAAAAAPVASVYRHRAALCSRGQGSKVSCEVLADEDERTDN